MNEESARSDEGKVPPQQREIRAGTIALATSALATCAFFVSIVFEGRIFAERDVLRVYYPVHLFWAASVRNGHFPLWYPYDGLGQPFVGMMVSGAFHPFNLLYLVLSPGAAMSASVLLCYVAAAVGTTLLCRRFQLGVGGSVLAGIVFAFSGYLVGISINPPYLASAAAIPWALWSADRFLTRPTWAGAGVAGLFLALVLFGGDPEAFAVTAALMIPLVLCRFGFARGAAPWIRLLAVWGLSALFALPQLVAALGAVAQGAPGGRTLAVATTWSFSPAQFYDLLVGPAWAAVAHTGVGYEELSRQLSGGTFASLWVDSLNVGPLVAVLCGAALWAGRRRTRTWVVAGAAVLVLWLALGSHGGLYALLFRLLPLFRPFRYPTKLMPFVTLALALGAGAGLGASESKAQVRRGVVFACGIVAVALALVWALPSVRGALVSVLAASSTSPQTLAELAAAVRETAAHAASVAAVGALVFGAPSVQRWRTPAAIVTVLAGLFAANHAVPSTALPDVLTSHPGMVAPVVSDPEVGLGKGRVASAAAFVAPMRPPPGLSRADLDASSNLIALRPDAPALWGIESVDSYLPAATAAVAQMQAHDARWLGSHTDLYSAHYVVVPPGGAINDRQKPLSFSTAFGLSLLKNLSPRPRAFLAQPRCVPDHESAVTALHAPGFDPASVAVVECGSAPPQTDGSESSGPSGSAAISSYRSDQVEVTVDAQRPSVLILNDAFSAGWTANVDGVPAAILRANALVRAVSVSAGHHAVIFTYTPQGFWAACWIALLSLAVVFTVGMYRCSAGRSGHFSAPR